ncbi:MAG: C40 family peptidase [Gallionella sp.]
MKRLFLFLALLLLAACSSPGPVAKSHQSSRANAPSPEAILNGADPEQTAAESGVAAPENFAPNKLTDYAQNLLGTRYRYGGNNPQQGFDCSGFVSYVYRNVAGVTLPRSSIEISRRGKVLDRDELRPGDLVFFNTLRHKFSHVGIYLGNNLFIHSPSSGGSVRKDDMSSDYWRKTYNGARRISD